ncbi:hypothetical protein O181_111970 [Austropuccinia psidii MF-1]|uniref:Uncharacterized protein n=1 Tax=Austropuccinia psidii MF-1 TaxID=1389203 RepID=A0A9Q3PT18_9BASI|nr:hypothetical protein [Austropuccinia psidii MF-1]
MAISGHFDVLGSYGPWTICRGMRSVVHGGYWRPPGANSAGDPGITWDQKMAHDPIISPTWPGPIEGVQDNQDPGLPIVAGEALGDEFSPKGVLNPHLRGFEGGHK